MTKPVGDMRSIMPSKILIVDDEVESLKLIGLMLKRQGYEVAMAENGQQALEGAHNEVPDLIILDVMMPDMDGYEVCRRLRSDESTRDIPIIMFTAKTLVDDKVAGFEAGADDYLTKPTHPAELAARVQAVLARSNAKQSDSKRPVMTYGFIGAKGGVGLSTLVTNVGALMAQNQGTSIVDFRLGRGTIALSLGFGQATGLADVLKTPDKINSTLIQDSMITHRTGLQVLPASIRSRESQLKLTPELAKTIIKTMGNLTPNVLVDFGPGLNKLTISMLRDMRQMTVAVEPNRVALVMSRDILQELNQVGIEKSRVNVVIVNRAASSLQISWQDAEQFLDHEISTVISSVPELAFQAIETEMPLAAQHPDAVVSGQYAKLTEKLVNQAQRELQ